MLFARVLSMSVGQVLKPYSQKTLFYCMVTPLLCTVSAICIPVRFYCLHLPTKQVQIVSTIIIQFQSLYHYCGTQWLLLFLCHVEIFLLTYIDDLKNITRLKLIVSKLQVGSHLYSVLFNSAYSLELLLYGPHPHKWTFGWDLLRTGYRFLWLSESVGYCNQSQIVNVSLCGC